MRKLLIVLLLLLSGLAVAQNVQDRYTFAVMDALGAYAYNCPEQLTSAFDSKLEVKPFKYTCIEVFNYSGPALLNAINTINNPFYLGVPVPKAASPWESDVSNVYVRRYYFTDSEGEYYHMMVQNKTLFIYYTVPASDVGD